MISTVLFLVQSLLHPFHVSVSEVKYKAEQKAIQISVRIFLDDLEVAMQEYSGNETLDITLKENWPIIDKNLSSYLPEKFKIYNEKGQLEANYIGAEIDGEVLWAYMEIEKVKRLRSITIWNSILHETFDDQENLIHFRAFDKVKSARLFKGEDQRVFVWDQ